MEQPESSLPYSQALCYLTHISEHYTYNLYVRICFISTNIFILSLLQILLWFSTAKPNGLNISPAANITFCNTVSSSEHFTGPKRHCRLVCHLATNLSGKSTASIFRELNSSSRSLRNVGKYLADCGASHHKR